MNNFIRYFEFFKNKIIFFYYDITGRTITFHSGVQLPNGSWKMFYIIERKYQK